MGCLYNRSAYEPTRKSRNPLEVAVEALWIALAGGLFWLGALSVQRAVVDLGRAARFSDTAIGLSLVGFAEAAPACVLLGLGAFTGKADLAAQAVLGAAIMQISGVLGLCALLRPVQSERRAALRGAVALGVAALYALSLCIIDTRQIRGFGFAGAVLIAAALIWTLRLRRAADMNIEQAWRAPSGIEKASQTAFSLIILFILLGGAALYAGGRLALGSAGELAALGTPSARLLAITLLALTLAAPGGVAMIMGALSKPGLHLGQAIARPTYSVLSGFCLMAVIAAPSLMASAPVALALCILVVLAGGLWTYGAGLSRRDGLLLVVGFLGFVFWFSARA